MSIKDKLLARLKNKPKDFTYDEAKTLMGSFGFEERNQGKTSGSRVRFFRPSDKRVAILHKPHPDKVLKRYMLDELIAVLKEIGEFDDE